MLGQYAGSVCSHVVPAAVCCIAQLPFTVKVQVGVFQESHCDHVRVRQAADRIWKHECTVMMERGMVHLCVRLLRLMQPGGITRAACNVSSVMLVPVGSLQQLLP